MDPALLLDLDGHGPKYAQIVRALAAAIRTRRLRAGATLPSTRRLARDLQCSRNIVILAFDQLRQEGRILVRARAGTVVASQVGPAESSAATGVAGGPDRVSSPPRGPSAAGAALVACARTARRATVWQRNVHVDFMYGLCAPDPQLLRALRRQLGASLASLGPGYGDSSGDPRLRTEIAARLVRARGVSRTADHVVVTNGAQQAFDLCARILVAKGDCVAVEDPGYEAAHAAFEAAGAVVEPVPVDARGLDPASLPRRRTRVAYVTPSHQFPTGVVLAPDRRQNILAWARRQGAYILEDDYDGELRYGSAPARALAGSDDRHVIYCGTFAKALFPSVRLGYLSLPDALVEPVRQAKWLLDRGSSVLLQRAVAGLMASGAYDRHMRRLQRRYSAKRQTLIRALRTHLGSHVDVTGAEAGYHLVVWLPREAAPHVNAIVADCRRRGVGLYSVAPLARRPLPRLGLILGYGIVDDRLIEDGVRVLAAAYQRAAR